MVEPMSRPKQKGGDPPGDRPIVPPLPGAGWTASTPSRPSTQSRSALNRGQGALRPYSSGAVPGGKVSGSAGGRRVPKAATYTPGTQVAPDPTKYEISEGTWVPKGWKADANGNWIDPQGRVYRPSEQLEYMKNPGTNTAPTTPGLVAQDLTSSITRPTAPPTKDKTGKWGWWNI